MLSLRPSVLVIGLAWGLSFPRCAWGESPSIFAAPRVLLSESPVPSPNCLPPSCVTTGRFASGSVDLVAAYPSSQQAGGAQAGGGVFRLPGGPAGPRAEPEEVGLPVAQGLLASPLALAALAVSAAGSDDLVVGGEWLPTKKGLLLVMSAQGGGGWTEKFRHEPDHPVRSLLTGDFNGDGRADIAAGSTGAVLVYLATQAGGFDPPLSTLAPGLYDQQPSGEDLDGDGHLDVVLPTLATDLPILYGKGDGTFDLQTYPGLGSTAVATADFDSDGRPDIAVSVYSGNIDGGLKLFVARNSSPRVFDPPQEVLRTSGWPYGEPWLLAGAIDDDQKPDLIGSEVGLLLGRGDGTFLEAGYEETTADLRDLDTPSPHLRDLDADGLADLVVSTSCGGLFLVRGLPGGHLEVPCPHRPEPGGLGEGPLALGLFDEDSCTDFAVRREIWEEGPVELVKVEDRVVVRLSNCQGGYRDTELQIVPGQSIREIVAEDLDADGDLDLAVLATDYWPDATVPHVSVLEGDGLGGFSIRPPMSLGASSPLPGHSCELGDLEARDFNGDGTWDLGLKGEYCWDGEGQLLSEEHFCFLEGQGGLAFADPVWTTFDGAGDLGDLYAAADLNGDRRVDHVRSSLSAERDLLGVYLCGGDGKLAPPVEYDTGLNADWVSGSRTVALADVNEDGRIDLVMPGSTGPWNDEVGAISVLLNLGAGTFGEPILYTVGGGQVRDVRVADLNGDQHVDLAFFSGGFILVLLGDGTGAFEEETRYWCADVGLSIMERDLDGDGDVDLAGRVGHEARHEGWVFIIENRGAPPLPTFRRGDTDADGRVNLSDAVALLEYLFRGGPPPVCLDAADADDSQELEITDALAILLYLFLAGEPPAAPGPDECGTDGTPGGPCWPRCLYPEETCAASG